MPGGYVSDLIDALDYCLDHGIDAACVGVGTEYPSALLAWKVEQVRAAGTCLIAAAGDDRGAVGYPAAYPGVVAVGALGSVGTYPAESAHADRLVGRPGPEGYFAGIRPAIDVYAPGIAVVGGAPGGGYAPRDGTALAAAHVTGVAALLASRDPRYTGGEPARDLDYSGPVRGVRYEGGAPRDPSLAGGAARADLLSRLLLAACRPVRATDGVAIPVPDASLALR
jgi:subtilisin family serine protease